MIFKKQDVIANINNKTADVNGPITKFYTEDKGTASVKISIKWQETPFDLTKTDLKPVLDLKTADGSIFMNEPLVLISPEIGVVEYHIPDNVIRHFGEIDCKLFLKNEEESVHVANFKIDITDSGIEGAVQKEISVNLVEDSVRKIMSENAMGLLDEGYKAELESSLKSYLNNNADYFKGPKGDTGNTGEKGSQGEQGIQGRNGVDGKDGTSITVSGYTINQNGDTVVKFSDNQEIIVYSGKQGTKGEDAKPLTVKSYSYDDSGNTTVNMSDNTSFTVSKGNQGEKGDKGEPGATGPAGKSGVDGKNAEPLTMKTSVFDGMGNTVVNLSDNSSFTVKKGDKGDKGDTGSIPNTDTWQKVKTTNDNGTTFFDSALKIDFSNSDQLKNLPIGTRYIASSTNGPTGTTSNNGWLTKYSKGDIQRITFEPYNSNQKFIKRFYNTWSDWEKQELTVKSSAYDSGGNTKVTFNDNTEFTVQRGAPGKDLKNKFMGAMLQLNSNINLAPNTTLYVPWQSAVYNESGFWDPANPTRIVVPKGVKKVRIGSNILWSGNDTGTKLMRVKKNGQYSIGLPYNLKTSSGTSAANSMSGPVPVNEGDYFELEVRHTSDVALDFRADPYTWFSIEVVDYEDGVQNNFFSLIGHRGASGYKDEHTIESYALGKAQGADYIEIDLQLTKDNKLVCMHDTTIDRTTTGTGNVSDLTLAQIQSYKTKSGLNIPSLQNVVDYFGTDVNYYIETKAPFNATMDTELIKILKNANLIGLTAPKNKVVIQSFAEDSLKNIRNQYSNLLFVRLFNSVTKEDILAASAYAKGIGPNFTNLTKELVDYAHSLGLVVHPWTVNTKEDMKIAKTMGVDGFFTNYPDLYYQS